MPLHIVIALILAAASTTLTNVAYSREHDAAAALPCLSMRRPVQSIRLLLSNRSWLTALVQSIGAGGIGVLAFASARMKGQRLAPRAAAGVWVSVLGLVLLAVSLAKNSSGGGEGSLAGILAWLGGSGALAIAVLAVGRKRGSLAVAQGIAGGLLFSIGDFSTKLVTQGGTHFAFVVTLVVGYTLGTSLLQLGYQRGAALTVAGLATLFTNALPIAAGSIVLHEPVPSGALGAARLLAYVVVTVGAILLAAPDPRSRGETTSQPPSVSPRAAGAETRSA